MNSTDSKERQQIFDALRQGAFIPYFQAQYNYIQNTVSGAEVLARWQKPDGSIEMPGRFIPVLEEDDSIIELDFQIMEKACVYLRSWLDEGLKLPALSFNLSRRTSLSEDLTSRILGILEKYSIDPKMIHLEITESAYIENYDAIFERIRELKNAGFVLEMDDFGKGYSSLGFLRNSPMDVLKLDMSFLQMDENRGKGGSIISSVVRLAGNLNMAVVAEGVEKLEQAEFLKSVGCSMMQGFYFAKPMSAEDFRQEVITRGVQIEAKDSFHEVNRALDFLDDTTQKALLFNSFVGGALILEYRPEFCSIVRANDRFFAEIGLDRDNQFILNQNLLSLFNNSNRSLFTEALEAAIRTESETVCEVTTDQVTDELVWLQFRVRCLAEKQDRTYVFYAVVSNVTEQKRLVFKNLDISRELSSVINNIPGGFARFSVRGEEFSCEYMSEGFIRLRGLSRTELEQGYKEGIAAFVHPEDHDSVLRTIRNMIYDQRGRKLTYRVRTAAGDYTWISSQNSVTKTGTGLSLFSYCWDETDRMQLRDKLQARNSELQSVRGSLDGGFALYEVLPDGKIELLEISEEAASISGYTEAEYMAEYMDDSMFCTLPADRKRVEKVVESVCSEMKDQDIMYRVITKEGHVVWVRFRATISFDGQRRLLYAFFSNLSSTREMFESIINDTDTAVVVTDNSTHEILFANELAASMGNLTAEKCVGCICYECLNKCTSIDQKCLEPVPPEGIVLDESRNGRIYRIRRKNIDWNGIDAGICYITDRTDTVFRDNSLVERPAVTRIAERLNDLWSDSGEKEKEEGRKWENMIRILRKRGTDYENLLTDEAIRVRLQFICVYIVLGVVSFCMTLMNMFTGWKTLGQLTLIYSLINLANVVLALETEKTEKLAQKLFGAEMITLFTAFAICGEPEGFSILWSVLLPTLGILLYGAKWGAALSGIQMLILIFLFWTVPGGGMLQYSYTDSFRMRFPVLFFALLVLGCLFEFIRWITQRELVRVRQQFEHLYNHDALTGLFNRYGFNSSIEEITRRENHGHMAFAILDIDNFKSVNDTYGHMQGDKVLKTIAGILQETVGDKGIVCRWGGEEFSVLFFDSAEATWICEEILERCRKKEHVLNGHSVHITVSIGLVKFEGFSLGGNSDVITRADDNLYRSKQDGKDRLTETELRLM